MKSSFHYHHYMLAGLTSDLHIILKQA